jgi:hypothetical protein
LPNPGNFAGDGCDLSYVSSRNVSGPTSAEKRLAAERAAAARARLATAQRRRRMWLVGGAVLAVLAVIGALVIVKVAVGGTEPKSGKKATTATSSLIKDLSSVPAASFDAVGRGSAQAGPSPITAAPLQSGGKPRVLYVGAEYCPYCAAERWAMALALTRFGTFSKLGTTASSPSDVYPNTATLSFHGADYSSTYLSFTGVETQSNQVVNGRYAPLDTLSAADEALVRKYNSSGGIPFIDFGGKYVLSGATYDPGLLQGKTHAQILAALADPASAIAKAVLGSANVLTAAICASTGRQPAAVCDSSGVRAATALLK